MERIIKDKCPRCGGEAYSEGVDVGVGYRYPPMHCDCGWSEMCDLYDEEKCKKCTEYEYCFAKGANSYEI